ncbi:MAG TPA: hypothetical protein VFE65_11865 [Pseudonocardia sp.]|jgi:hypothetical protein|nr:hypothetical protein [Pseudonocardia sp.]
MTAADPASTEYRILLAEMFAQAEGRGLGTLNVGFTATPGKEEEAADYIGPRSEFLAGRKF